MCDVAPGNEAALPLVVALQPRARFPLALTFPHVPFRKRKKACLVPVRVAGFLISYLSRLCSSNKKSKIPIIVMPASFLQRGVCPPVMIIFLNESDILISDACS